MKRKVKHFRRKRRNYMYNKGELLEIILRAFEIFARELGITAAKLKEQWHEQTNSK